MEMDIGIPIHIGLRTAHLKTLTYLPRHTSTQEHTKIVIFNKVPSGTLRGNDFAEDENLQVQKMRFDFRVVRVHGHVRWKDHGSGDAIAALKLKRGNFITGQNLAQLDLAGYARGSSPDAVTAVDFDFKPDEHNSFWRRGVAGKYLAAIPFGFDWCYCKVV